MHRRNAHRAEIGIALFQNFTGMGIGTIMMKRLIAAAASAGFRQCELSVVSTNQGAIRLYKKLGFTECGRIPCANRYADGSFSDDIFMTLELCRVGIRIPRLPEVDTARERLLKEYIPGPTIAQLVGENGIKPEYLEDVRQMCRLLYPAGLNIDYYPTNFVVREEALWYIDCACNRYDEKWNFENWGQQYWHGP